MCETSYSCIKPFARKKCGVACGGGHAECIDLLLPVSDSAEVLRRLRDQYPHNPELSNALADAVAQQQKQVLENAIERFAAPVCVRKM